MLGNGVIVPFFVNPPGKPCERGKFKKPEIQRFNRSKIQKQTVSPAALSSLLWREAGGEVQYIFEEIRKRF
jgi:hypothetical protein